MKLAHYVFLAIFILPFVLPKLAWWLVGAMFVVAFVGLLIAGPAHIASWFLPRPPKS